MPSNARKCCAHGKIENEVISCKSSVEAEV